MAVQTFDFIINSRLGPTSLADIKEYNAQLERMIELQKQAGMGGMGGGGFGPGGGGGGGNGTGSGGGFGGGSGGGLPGSEPGPGPGGGPPPEPGQPPPQPQPPPQTTPGENNSHNNNAASAGGIGNSRIGGFDPIASAFSSAMASEGMGPGDSRLSPEEQKAQRLRTWQRTVGVQALGYGLEDLYYSGFRGVLNNLPFMAQGAASALGVNPFTAEMMAGQAALIATTGYVAYENRKPIADALGYELPSRAQSLIGLAERSRAEKLQEQAANDAYYVDKYGSGSALGQMYMSQSARNIAQAQRAAGLDPSAMDIARINNALSPAQQMAGRNLQGLGLGGDFVAKSISDSYTPSNTDIQNRAQQLFKDSYYTDLYGNSAILPNLFLSGTGKAFPTVNDFTDKAKSSLEATGANASRIIADALSGNPESVRTLQDALQKDVIPASLKQTANAALSISKNITGFDRGQIESLRAAASNPFANLKNLNDQISNILSGYKGENGDISEIMNPLAEGMNEANRQAMTPWQQTYLANKNRYVSNIAASFGGIQANGSQGRLRNTQRNNLKASIVEDLISSGVPAVKARQLAEGLYSEGYASYKGNMDAANMNNGFSNMENFVMMLGDEQQLAFSQFQQNRIMIQMQQSALRRNAWMRNRAGLRGSR